LVINHFSPHLPFPVSLLETIPGAIVAVARLSGVRSSWIEQKAGENPARDRRCKREGPRIQTPL
jgi:hypothetical protein